MKKNNYSSLKFDLTLRDLFASALAALLLLSSATFPAKAAPTAGSPTPESALQDDWTSWRPIDYTNGVSARFRIVQRDYRNGMPLWTWQLKNDESSTITYMEFTYTDYSSRYESRERKDILPRDLTQGDSVGGWAAFTAVAPYEPTLRITKIKRG
jgi:hypothetical protein